MKKILKENKKNIKGGKITKVAMFEKILSIQMYGNIGNSILNLINQIIYYSNPNNIKQTTNNFMGPNAFLKANGNANYSSVSFGY